MNTRITHLLNKITYEKASSVSRCLCFSIGGMYF